MRQPSLALLIDSREVRQLTSNSSHALAVMLACLKSEAGIRAVATAELHKLPSLAILHQAGIGALTETLARSEQYAEQNSQALLGP
ncbi:hypothetical protein BST61_g11056 [Cercospora zeina]